MLAQLGLAAYFDENIFSAAGIDRGKPHPDIYLHAASCLGVPPSQCLVIEDHPVGVAAGAAAGMTVFALLAASHIRRGMRPGSARRERITSPTIISRSRRF
ncbi:MAG: HAD-IA family hydrolase [Sphingosinicella sp.]|nr:HAD-IA family hydrolase [Sphingosinicella sp.]